MGQLPVFAMGWCSASAVVALASGSWVRTALHLVLIAVNAAMYATRPAS